MFEQFDEHMQSGPVGKNLHVRATGKFYTPQLISKELAEQISAHLVISGDKSIRVIDPFCGDGRLVVQLIRTVSQHRKQIRWNVTLWDSDPQAVITAGEAVRKVIKDCNALGRVYASVADTFQKAESYFDSFDAVVTNPPWETIKPDRRELEYLPASQRTAYTNTLRARANQITELFPLSQPSRKFSGWGTNLARVGTELALRLSRPDGGICGIVSPASLFGDQVSRTLRKWMFSCCAIKAISFFPAEGRFFRGVDQPVISMVACRRPHKQSCTALRIFDRTGALATARELNTSSNVLAAFHYTLPIQFGPTALDALTHLQGLPVFGDLEGTATADLWAGRELDETGRARYLSSFGAIRFAKGEMITRYATSATPEVFVDPQAIRIPTSVSHMRVGWRDISRPNQKRRMHASLIPKDWATGNSLHVTYFRDDNHDRLLALLVVLNSLVCEFQVRARLATAHISLGVVRQAHLPDLSATKVVRPLAVLARRCLEGDQSAYASTEVAVAKAYGLDRSSFGRIVELFPKLNCEEKELMLASGVWSGKARGATYTG